MSAPANSLLCADAMHLLEQGDMDETADLVLTSPPYDDIRSYEGYAFDYKRMLAGIYRALKDGGVCVWVVGDRIKQGNRSLTSFRQGIAAQEVGFKCHDVMIYQKLNTPFMRRNAYTRAHELMLVFVKGKLKTFNPLKKKSAGKRTSRTVQASKKPDGSHKDVVLVTEAGRDINLTNVWTYATGSGVSGDKEAFDHPAIFPELLAADHISSWTNEGDLVLDPMCGSGTTLKMSHLMGRRFIGIDISRKYVAIAKKRLGKVANLFL